MKKKLLILGMVMALFVVTVVPMTVSAATPTLGGENSSIGIGKPQAVWKITTVDSRKAAIACIKFIGRC